MGRGATKWDGGASEVLPLRKGGDGNSFSHSEREGPQKVWGSFHAVVLAILKGGHKKFPLFKRGAQNVLPCLEGGAQKVSDLQFSHFVVLPPPHN